jgi:hypothetical protein
MSPSQDYIMLRASRTLQCMKVILAATPSWEWPELSVVDYEEKYIDCDALIEAESTEAADTTGERGGRDAKLDLLRAKGQQFIALGKRKYRKDGEKMRLLRPLKMDTDTVAGTLGQALAVDSAWQAVDAAYVPDTGNTYAAFNALRLECKTRQEAVSKEFAEESGAGGKVRVALKDLYRWSVDWYQEAFRRFSAGTAHGMMIRELIPTQPGAGGPVPGQAVLQVVPQIGHSDITVTAEGANAITIRYRPAGTTEWLLVVTGLTTGMYQHMSLVPGFYDYIAQGHNNDGDGPESEIVTVEVT